MNRIETARERQSRLTAEIERRRALSEATGVDHITAWLLGVREGRNVKDGPSQLELC